MATFGNSYSIHGLSSSGSPTSTATTGSLSLGETQQRVTLTGADIFYAVKITSTGATDVATLTLSSGAVAQTTGTPTIVDGDGNDFEGETLPTMVNIQALQVKTGSVEGGTISVADSGGNLVNTTFSTDSGVILFSSVTGQAVTTNTIVITFDTVAQDVTLILAGKSS